LAVCEFRESTSEDLEEILRNVRQENIDELQVFDDLGIGTALTLSIDNSSEAFVAVIDDEVVAAFGVVPSGTPGLGKPWMVGTSNIDHHAIAFLRLSKQVLTNIMLRWPRLENWADARNVRGLRWLRFMGFTIHDPILLGEKGLPFHRFEKGAA
jgi:hypothetical protein